MPGALGLGHPAALEHSLAGGMHGVGLDALNLPSDAHTVAVFDAETFDDIFRDMTGVNEEGIIAKDDETVENFVFEKATMERRPKRTPFASSGTTCLTLPCSSAVPYCCGKDPDSSAWECRRTSRSAAYPSRKESMIPSISLPDLQVKDPP